MAVVVVWEQPDVVSTLDAREGHVESSQTQFCLGVRRDVQNYTLESTTLSLRNATCANEVADAVSAGGAHTGLVTARGSASITPCEL